MSEASICGMKVVRNSFLPPDTVLLVNTGGMNYLRDLRPPLDLVDVERKQRAKAAQAEDEVARFLEDPAKWSAELDEALAFTREVLAARGVVLPKE